MSSIPYDALDLMRVLGVEPQLDDLAFCAFYVVERDGLKLDVSISLAEPRVEISLERVHNRARLLFLSFWCSQILRIERREEELLEFSRCLIGHLDLDPSSLFLDAAAPFFSIHLGVQSGIRIEFV